MKKSMKRLCGIGLTVALLMSGCAAPAASSSSSSSAVSAETEKKDPLSLAEIYKQICDKVELNNPMELPENYITNYYDLDLSLVDEYVFSTSSEAVSGETIAMVKVKDEESASKVQDALQLMLDGKRSELENYVPEQYEIAKKASVEQEGNYMFLIISENYDQIHQIIMDGIS